MHLSTDNLEGDTDARILRALLALPWEIWGDMQMEPLPEDFVMMLDRMPPEQWRTLVLEGVSRLLDKSPRKGA